MTPVQGDDHVRLESISEDDDRGVYRPEREVAIPLDEVGYQRPIVGMRIFHAEPAQASYECSLAAWSKAQSCEMGNLGDYQGRDDEVQVPPAKHVGASDVIGIPPVERRQQRPGVKDRD